MSELLGLTGAIGSGKTTFAELLCNVAQDHASYETWRLVAEIADVFNQALKAELGYETSNSQIELANQILIWLPEAIAESLHRNVSWKDLAISKHTTLQHPELYEKLFLYLKKISVNPKLLDSKITDHNKEEFRPLLQWIGGYLVVKVDKSVWFEELMNRIQLRNPATSLVVVGGVRYHNNAEMIRENDGKIIRIERPNLYASNTDVTEVERGNINPDAVVHNNGTIAQLQILAENLINDLTAGALQKNYFAKTL